MHQLIVKSLYDAQADCSCGGWHFVATGERTKAYIESEFRKHLNQRSSPLRHYHGPAYRVESNLVCAPNTLQELVDFEADELGNCDIREQVAGLGLAAGRISARDVVWVTKTRSDALHYAREGMPVERYWLRPPKNAVILATDGADGGFLVYHGETPLQHYLIRHPGGRQV